MAKSRIAYQHDWAKLKLKFFASEHQAVRPFLVAKQLDRSGNAVSRTQGWADEKRELVAKIVEQQYEKFYADEVAQVERKLIKAKYKVLDEIVARLRVKIKVVTINDNGQQGEEWITKATVSELRDIWGVLKVELNEPTTIVQRKEGAFAPIDEIPEGEMERMILDANNEAKLSGKEFNNTD